MAGMPNNGCGSMCAPAGVNSTMGSWNEGAPAKTGTQPMVKPADQTA